MAFCMYCGKQLEDGEVCNCQNGGNSAENLAGSKSIQLEKQQTFEQPSGQFGGQQMNQQTFGQPGGQQMNQQTFGQPGGQFGGQQMNQQTFGQPGGQFGGQQMNQQTFGQPGGQFGGQQMNQQQYQEKFNQAKEVSGIYLQQLWGALLGVLKRPVEEGKRFAASGDKKLAIGFFAVQAILSSIFAMVICGKINSVEKAAASLIGGIDSKYLFSLPKAFILTIIGSMILSFILTGLLYVGVKILKGTTTFWHMACVAAVRSVGTSIFILVSIVVTFLNLSWGIAIFALSALVGLIFMIPVIQSGATLDENAQIYMVVIVAILAIVVYFILCKVGMPMYVPSGLKDSYKDLMENLSDLSSFSGLY